MKTITKGLLGLSLSLAAHSSFSEVINVEISNLTQGMFFTPVLIAAHNDTVDLYELGEAASPDLAAMAEGGNFAGLSSAVTAASGVVSENPAMGMLAPASSTYISDFDTGSNASLSITAMLLPTNDAFVGLDSWAIPSVAGTYTVYLNAYDAGTEANDERLVDGSGMPGVAGIPGNPGMNGGTGGTGVTSTETNTMVHVHRGNMGDTEADSGVSDVDSRIHRWLNPVAKVTITVQ